MHAVILYSVGSPETLTSKCIKQYLTNFLSDKMVVRINRFLWQPILHSCILTTRPERLLKRYAEIFEDGKNPYLQHVEDLTHKLAESLNGAAPQTSSPSSPSSQSYMVRYAYAYSEPSLQQVVSDCVKAGAQEITTIPLFPQYSDTTSKRPVLALKRLKEHFKQCKFKVVRAFSDHELYIKAIAETTKPYLEAAAQEHKQPPHLLITYHSLPMSYIKLGDPYLKECQATTKALSTALSLDSSQYTVAFQSKMGPMSWLKPYIEDACTQILDTQHHNLVVLAPGFSIDCLETLYDLGRNLREQFLTQGGERFALVPCLNEHDLQVQMLQGLLNTAQDL